MKYIRRFTSDNLEDCVSILVDKMQSTKDFQRLKHSVIEIVIEF